MSPTYKRGNRFRKDFLRLTPEQRKRFAAAVMDMVADLRAGRPFRTGLRVKRVQGTAQVWEMTWAPDGRATWEYGPQIRKGERHVNWRRVGSHDVLNEP